jgi:hypothetical protein
MSFDSVRSILEKSRDEALRHIREVESALASLKQPEKALKAVKPTAEKPARKASDLTKARMRIAAAKRKGADPAPEDVALDAAAREQDQAAE